MRAAERLPVHQLFIVLLQQVPLLLHLTDSLLQLQERRHMWLCPLSVCVSSMCLCVCLSCPVCVSVCVRVRLTGNLHTNFIWTRHVMFKPSPQKWKLQKAELVTGSTTFFSLSSIDKSCASNLTERLSWLMFKSVADFGCVLFESSAS